MAPSSDLVVLAARRATHVTVLDVLRDWSSLGLVGPVCLVDVDAIRPDELRIPAIVLEHGATRPVVLQEELSSRTHTGVARLCGLTEVGQEVVGPSNDVGMSLLGSVTNALPGVEIVRAHVVGVALQGSSPGENLCWLGWHNVLVAPENAQAPTTGVSPIVYTPGDPVRISHFVAAVCSLAGLWAAEPSGPLDARPVAPGKVLVAARTFTRHLSALAVESELFARLASVEHGYPVPLFEGSSAWQVDDPVGAATDMAERLFAKHPYLLPRQRQLPPSRPPRRIGPWAALKMLFRFLWAALRNAPRTFLDRVVHNVSMRTARLVGGLVFGGGSEYDVVVNGVRADGMPASWSEIDETLEQASNGLAGGAGVVHLSNADLTAFWMDYVGAGLTLLDAGARSSELPPRMSGSRRGIITDGGRVAPDPDDVFETPENVSAYVKRNRVNSNDVVAARFLAAELDEVGRRQHHLAGQAQNTGMALREWFGNHERSYTGRVGLTLAQGIAKVRAEISANTDALQSAEAATEIPARIEEQQDSLAGKLKMMCVLAVLAAVAVVAYTVLGPPGWLFLSSAIVGIVLVWLLSSMLVFMRAQRDLFALLHARRELATQIETLQLHLMDAVEDMRRLTRAYRQYLDWSKAFGRFVAAPLGRPPALLDDEVVLGNGFPRNHRFGAASPDTRALDETATRLKRDLFGVGWASHAWEAFLRDVPQEVGNQAFRIREDVDILYADPGVASESLLTTWADVVVQREDWKGATDTLRSRVADLMTGGGDDLVPKLLAQVETRDAQGWLETVNYESFVNRLDDPAANTGPHQSFARDLFGPHAASEPWRVASTVSHQGSAHFGRTLVVTQFSHGFQSYELRLDPPGGVAKAPALPRLDPEPTTPDSPFI